MDVVLKRKTGNAKLTGGKTRKDVWVLNPLTTYDTCPTTCTHLPKKLFDIAVSKGMPVAENPSHACYANGRVAHFAVKGGEVLSLSAAVDAVIADAPIGGLIRWAEVGDIMVDNPRGVIDDLSRIKDARPDLTVIAYTHAWRVLGGYGSDLFRASCETPIDVVLATSLGYRAAITVPEDWTVSDAIDFRRDNNLGATFICPAETKGRSCIDCRACDNSAGNVAFPAHGTRKRWAGQGVA